jgi:hypothetical protein
MVCLETTIAAKTFQDRIFRTYRIAIYTTSSTPPIIRWKAANGDARAALAAIVTTIDTSELCL